MWIRFILLTVAIDVGNAAYCHDDEVCLWFSRCHDKEQFSAVREKQELDETCKKLKISEARTDVAVKIRPESPNDWHFDIFVRDFSETAVEFGENRLEFINGTLALFHLLNDTIVEEVDIPMEAHAKVKTAARANFTLSLNQSLISIFDGSVVRYTKINGTVAKYSEQEIWEQMKDILWDQAHPPTSIPPDENAMSIKCKVKFKKTKIILKIFSGQFIVFMGIIMLIIILAILYYLYRRMKDQRAENTNHSTKKVFENSFKCQMMETIA